MFIIEIIIAAGVGTVAGWLASQFMKGSDFGLAGDIVLGIAGAIAGGWWLPQFDALDPIVGSIINCCIGACVALLVLRPFVRRA
jgi:uncharacterized membrane protein YeaQ/YmgE (transglycosylase-associated protein family)